MWLTKWFRTRLGSPQVTSRERLQASLSDAVNIFSTPDHLGTIAKARARFLDLFLDQLPSDLTCAANLWLIDQQYFDSVVATLWATRPKNLASWNISQLRGVSVHLPKLPSSESTSLSYEDAARRCVAALKERLGEFDAQLESLSSVLIPLVDQITNSDKHLSTRVLGYVQIVGPLKDVSIFQEDHQSAAQFLGTIVASRITFGRQHRIVRATKTFQSRIAELSEPNKLIEAALDLLQTYSNAIDARCFIEGPHGRMSVVRSSTRSRNGVKLVGAEALMQTLMRRASHGDRVDAINIHNVLDLSIELDLGVVPQAVQKPRAIGAVDGAVAMLLLRAFAKPTAPGEPTPPSLFSIRLLTTPEQKPIGGSFSATDIEIASAVIEQLIVAIPAAILRHSLAKLTTAISVTRQSMRDNRSRGETIEGERQWLDTFGELLTEMIPPIRHCLVCRRTGFSGADTLHATDSLGREVVLPAQLRWPQESGQIGGVYEVDGKVFLPITVYFTQQEAVGILLELSRIELQHHERTLIEFVASELSLFALGELDVSDKIKQLAEIRHHVKNELNAFLGNIRRVVEPIYSDASELYKSGNEREAASLIFREAAFHKSLEDATDSATQIALLFESARILLGDMTTDKLQLSSWDIAQLVNDQIRNLRFEADRRKVKVELINQYPREVPQPVVDRNWISVCISNLIDNAIKYSYSGQSVTVVLGIRRNRWFLTVRNVGPHIPAERSREIFLPFRRLARTSGQQSMPGTGIGLAAVKEILRLHDQEALIEVESNLREELGGPPNRALTEFTISLRRSLSGGG